MPLHPTMNQIRKNIGECCKELDNIHTKISKTQFAMMRAKDIFKDDFASIEQLEKFASDLHSAKAKIEMVSRYIGYIENSYLDAEVREHKDRSRIPEKLCQHIVEICEEGD